MSQCGLTTKTMWPKGLRQCGLTLGFSYIGQPGKVFSVFLEPFSTNVHFSLYIAVTERLFVFLWKKTFLNLSRHRLSQSFLQQISEMEKSSLAKNCWLERLLQFACLVTPVSCGHLHQKTVTLPVAVCAVVDL
jgi:hypothetical protein